MQRWSWGMVIMTLAFSPLAAAETECLPSGFPIRQAPLLLCRAQELAQNDLSAEDLAWLTRFRLLVTNGYDYPSPAVARALRTNGCRLFRYFWANGFTTNEAQSTSLPDGPWRQQLLRDHPEWLLAAEPLEGPPGTPPSYYYDFISSELMIFLSQQIAQTRTAGGYAGTFFDYAGVYALPQRAAGLWREKHPDLSYDQALARLLEVLRAVDRGTLIFTNQAVLGDPRLLTAVDYDMVESYGTSFAWGPTVKLAGEDFPLTYRRPWDGPGGIKAMMTPVMERLRTGPPRGELLCLDYMRPALTRRDGQWRPTVDLEAVYYSYCMAALWGLNSYCSGWYGQEYRGPLYFADLGRPLGDGPVELEQVMLREYERGLVVLLRRAEAAEVRYRLQANCGGQLWDLRTGRTLAVREGMVTLRLRPTRVPLSDEMQPIGRVYLKSN
ncbi:MAG: hypothetical protein HPY69_01105 [Armatimonadetes bacterium]|nr:hypothetical protein [Armatimonadota bacterium]